MTVRNVDITLKYNENGKDKAFTGTAEYGSFGTSNGSMYIELEVVNGIFEDKELEVDNSISVEYTATVKVEKWTVAIIEAARVAAGAPEDALFYPNYDLREDVSEVKFVWSA